MEKLTSIILLIAGLFLYGCNSIATDEEIALTVAAQLDLAQVETETALSTNTSTAPQDTPTPQTTLTPMRLSAQEPLPEYLLEVRPAPGNVIRQAAYQTVITTTAIYEGPPPPSVEITGYRSSICIYLDVSSLVGPGDDLVLDKDVLPRIGLSVNGSQMRELARTAYLAVINCCPVTVGFGSDPNEYWDWSAHSTPPPHIGAFSDHGYWFCYKAELGVGVHEAIFNFRKTEGVPVSYSWSFAITE